MTNTSESIVRLERRVWQAVVKNDGAALAELFADDYVEITLEGKRVLKADVVNESPQIDNIRSYSIAQERVIPLGPDRALLSYHLTLTGECRGVEISPADRWATSIWVQSSDGWKCSFFQQSQFEPDNDETAIEQATEQANAINQRQAIDFEPTAADMEFIDTQLGAFNTEQTKRDDFEPLPLVRRSDDGSVIGGLKGMTGWDWLHVEILWVDQKHRGEGIGTALLAAAEAVARERGCIGSCLTSYSFQAPAFYEQHGYSTFGQIDDYPIGKTMYFMSKRFAESTP